MKAIRAAQKQTASPLRVNVKVTEDSDPGRCRDRLSQMRGVRSVIQTFPDEMDQELNRLFVLEIDPSEVDSALKELRQRHEIEYAETAPRRKLIR